MPQRQYVVHAWRDLDPECLGYLYSSSAKRALKKAEKITGLPGGILDDPKVGVMAFGRAGRLTVLDAWEGGNLEAIGPWQDRLRRFVKEGVNPRAKAKKKKHEVFHFLLSSWDIDVADAILAKSPREPKVVDIAGVCGMTGIIRIDPKTKKQADLSIPIYIAPFRTKGGVEMLPIDGWHRIALACDEGVEELPAIVFTEKEAKRIRIR